MISPPRDLSDETAEMGESRPMPGHVDDATGYLVVAHPPGERHLPLFHGRARLGRAPATESGQYELQDRRISKAHAELRHVAGRFELQDLGSRNGLYVDGAMISPGATTELFDGSVIRIGDTVLVFRPGAPVEAQWAHPGLPGGAPAVVRARRRLTSLLSDTCHFLVLGETGTGKEFVARWIAGAPETSEGAVILNCAHLQRGTARAELFGVERGAFTDAREARSGLLAEADGRTLFLDELGELEPQVQAELLRFLEDGRYRPVGGTRERQVRTRVVGATNADLDGLAAQGTFRGDLLARFRASTAEVRLPPLRDRREDLVTWARRFHEQPNPQWTAGFVECLLLYPWPTNLRGLAGAIRTLRREHPAEETLRSLHLPDPIQSHRASLRAATSSASASPPTRTSSPSAEEIAAALSAHKGNVKAAAQSLGVERRRFYRLCESMKLHPEHFRER